MTGGLLNLVSYGNPNIILNGNPSKTFFKVVYSKYTNFGMQKFRIDYKGLRSLRLSEESQFTFKIPRYAELLMDTYVAMHMRTISLLYMMFINHFLLIYICIQKIGNGHLIRLINLLHITLLLKNH